MTWIDTHAHLNSEEFEADLPAVLDRARSAGVERILVIGTDRADSERAVRMAESDATGMLRAVVGLQPNNLNEAGPDDFDAIENWAALPSVVAVGETGLDRYWKTVPFDRQEEFFRRHLALAHAVGKPVVIHCREAEADVVRELSAWSATTGEAIAGVMHSFTGDERTAAECVALGLHVSFAGMVTFKKNHALRAVAASIPLDRLLVETDSPYLSPEPFRGKPNEPARVIHTGECLAAVHGISADELARQTTENARRLFQLS